MATWDMLSTLEQLKRDLPAVKDSSITDDELINNIIDAKDVIYDDLSKYADWEDMEDLDAVPRTLQRLSRYQSVILTILRGWRQDNAALTNDELGDSVLKYHQERYDNLLEQIETGDIIILDSDHDSLELDEMKQTGPGRVI